MTLQQTVDLRSLALLRVLLGLYLLYDVYSRLKHGRMDLLWYTSDGWQHPQDSPHRSPIHQLWFYRGSSVFQLISFGIVVVLSIMFTLGYYCNGITKTLLWLSVVAMQHRNMHSHDGSDTYTRHILLWCCQLPVEQIWTIRPVLGTTTTTTTTTSAATLGLTLQVVFMYLGTCLHRTTDLYSIWELTKSEWLPPQLSAVYCSLSSSFASRDYWLGNVVRQTPLLNQFMTFSAMLIEGLAPIGCFILPFQYQHYPAILLFSLHFGLLLLMNLPNWQFIGMLTTVMWIPSHIWDHHFNLPLKLHDEGKKTDITIDHISLQQQQQHRRRASNYLTRFFLCYMIYNFLGEHGVVTKHDDGDIGEFLRFSQHWVMFSVPPKTSVHAILVGTTPNGTTTDIWKWIQSTHPLVPMNLTERQSQLWTNMTHVYPSPRWERAFDGWGQEQDQVRARYFLQTLCRQAQFSELALIWQYLRLGSVARFERRGSDLRIIIQCHLPSKE